MPVPVAPEPAGNDVAAAGRREVAEFVPPTVEERLAQIEAAPGLAELAEDGDEALFLEAFGGDHEDPHADELLADAVIAGAPRAEARIPIYAPPGTVRPGAPALEAPRAAGGGAVGAVREAPDAAAAWRPLFSLPGYGSPGRAGEAIRALGRQIFRTMPCFQSMEAECRAAGRDPLGEVQVMANIAGRGPASRQQMDAMATWIRANGTVVDAARIDFTAVMPGYRPNVILAATEDESFLMVEEMRDVHGGAPHESAYIYSWMGGRQLYLADQNARDTLQRLEAVGRPVLAAPVARQVEAAPALPAPRVVVQPAPPAGRRRPAGVGAEQAPAARDAVDEALPALDPVLVPATRHVRTNPVQDLRAAGFLPFGTDEGPAFRRDSAEGGHVLVFGEGRSIALATSFSVRRMDASGIELARDVVEGASAAVAWAGDIPSRRP